MRIPKILNDDGANHMCNCRTKNRRPLNGVYKTEGVVQKVEDEDGQNLLGVQKAALRKDKSSFKLKSYIVQNWLAIYGS